MHTADWRMYAEDFGTYVNCEKMNNVNYTALNTATVALIHCTHYPIKYE